MQELLTIGIPCVDINIKYLVGSRPGDGASGRCQDEAFYLRLGRGGFEGSTSSFNRIFNNLPAVSAMEDYEETHY